MSCDNIVSQDGVRDCYFYDYKKCDYVCPTIPSYDVTHGDFYYPYDKQSPNNIKKRWKTNIKKEADPTCPFVPDWTCNKSGKLFDAIPDLKTRNLDQSKWTKRCCPTNMKLENDKCRCPYTVKRVYNL